MSEIRKKLRLRNRTHFTIVLLGSTAILTFLVWQSLVYFPRIWDWPIFDIRTNSRGKVPQSIFIFFSLIPGFLGGLAITDSIRRGYKDGPGVAIFFVPYLAAVAAVAEIRFLDLFYEAKPTASNIFHLLLFLLWLANMLAYKYLLKFLNKSR